MKVLAVRFINDPQTYYIESFYNDTIDMQKRRNGIGVHSHVKEADNLSVATTPHKDEALVFDTTQEAVDAQTILRDGLANFLTTGNVKMPAVWRDACSIVVQPAKFSTTGVN